MIKYDFLEARRVNLSNLKTDSQLNIISLLVSFLFKFGIIITRYEYL